MRRQAIGEIALGENAVDGLSVAAYDQSADLLGAEMP
jgi:hypothetical protein